MISARPLGSTSAPYGYYEYLPPGYSSRTDWPILIFNHGVGELGNGTDQLSKIRNFGPMTQIDAGYDYPMVILSPQAPSWTTPNGDTTMLDQFVTYALKTYKVDPKRLYMTGLSMGGGATFDYAAAHPERLAAIVPICAAISTGPSDQLAGKLIANGVAIWAAHAVNDGRVSFKNTTYWFDALGRILGAGGDQNSLATWNWNWNQVGTANFDVGKKMWTFTPNFQGYRDANGRPFNPPLILTLYPSGDHYIWDRMYSDQQMYAWLLLQARSSTH